MDVAITRFRSELKHWLDIAQSGEEIVITDRGVPIARVTGLSVQAIIKRLEDEGRLTAPEDPTPLDIDTLARVPVSKPVSDLVSSQRD